MSDYADCLRLAGAEILAYETFGSYQGDWIAKVRYSGQVYWIRGYYGSCTHCDGLKAELNFDYHYCENDSVFRDELSEYMENVEFCEECAKVLTKARILGESYLENDNFSYQELLKKFEEDSEWDYDAREVVRWLKEKGGDDVSTRSLQAH